MRKNAAKVIKAFLSGNAAIGDNKETISTDGHVLWSYKMPIAARTVSGKYLLVEYDEAPSATTRSHVRACEQVLIDPIRCTKIEAIASPPTVKRRVPRPKRTSWPCDNKKCEAMVRSPGLCGPCSELAEKMMREIKKNMTVRYYEPSGRRKPRFTMEAGS